MKRLTTTIRVFNCSLFLFPRSPFNDGASTKIRRLHKGENDDVVNQSIREIREAAEKYSSWQIE
jgi:hypothetical protein